MLSIATRQAVQQKLLDAAGLASSEASQEGLFKLPATSVNEAWITSFAMIQLNDLLRQHHKQQRALFVTCETTVDYLDCVFDRSDEHWITLASRFDLVLWDEIWPFAVTEIKHSRHMNRWDLSRDAEKISGAMSRWPQLTDGYFLFSSSRDEDMRTDEFDEIVRAEGFRTDWKQRKSGDLFWYCARTYR